MPYGIHEIYNTLLTSDLSMKQEAFLREKQEVAYIEHPPPLPQCQMFRHWLLFACHKLHTQAVKSCNFPPAVQLAEVSDPWVGMCTLTLV